MASRSFYPVKTLNNGAVVVSGSFAPNGTSAVDQASIKGKGIASVARTGTGAFLVTLQDKWADCISARADVQLHTAADTQAQVGDVDVVSAKTVVITLLTAGSAADVAANANNRVHFELRLRNSSIP